MSDDGKDLIGTLSFLAAAYCSYSAACRSSCWLGVSLLGGGSPVTSLPHLLLTADHGLQLQMHQARW